MNRVVGFPKLFCFAIVLISTPIASADIIYRETFSHCSQYEGKFAALNSGWQALRYGKTLGNPGFMKVFPPGSSHIRTAVQSNPRGSTEGHAFWSKPSKALLIVTDEFRFDLKDLNTITYEQRLDAKSNTTGRNIDVTHIALLINDTWWISDKGQRQNHVGYWEPVTFHPHEHTFGTSRYVPGHGTTRPEGSGMYLPVSGEVQAFGVFIPYIRDRVRLDNFTVTNFGLNTEEPLAEEPDCDCGDDLLNIDLYCGSGKVRKLKGGLRAKYVRRLVRMVRENSLSASRDRAILSMFGGAKITTDQISRLSASNYVSMGSTSGGLLVNGKRPRFLRISSFAAMWLDTYLAESPALSSSDTPLIRSLSPDGNSFTQNPYCPQQVYRTVRRYAKRARLWKLVRSKRRK